MSTSWIAVLLLAALVLSDAHMQPTHRGLQNCTCVPGSKPAESYHIHVMFYPPDAPKVNPKDPAGNNPNNFKNAAALRTAFIQHFNVSECVENMGQDPVDLCSFAIDPATGGQPFPAAQPFVTTEFAFFVPVDRWVDAVPWMMLNRGVFDVLVHPNTCGWSCAPQDHLLSSFWMGNSWPVKFRLPASTNNDPDCHERALPSLPPTLSEPTKEAKNSSGHSTVLLMIMCGILVLLGVIAAALVYIATSMLSVSENDFKTVEEDEGVSLQAR